MLLSLSIRDFAVVTTLDLELEAGFTVLTGETGAGKSILIDALQFVLGGRAETLLVREGANRAEVAAGFAAGPALLEWAAGQGWPVPDPGEPLLVRRTLDSSGRSRAYVGGSAATAAQLRALGEQLLDVHGQHAHQSLLRTEGQRSLLDALGGATELAASVARAHGAWRTAQTALARGQGESEERARQQAAVQACLDDLEPLAPLPGEWEQVEAEQRRLAHAADLEAGCRAALGQLAEEEPGLEQQVARLSTRLQALAAIDPQLAGCAASLDSASIALADAASALGHYLDSERDDGERRALVEARVSALHAAGRRWRCPPTELPQRLEQARLSLAALQADGDLAALARACTDREAQFLESAAQLTRARQAAASALEHEVAASLPTLGMGGARLVVALVAGEAAASGLERVELQIASHAGGTPRPLARVASGGELSRVSLAIAVAAARANPVPTLIFDEVDAGIGGQVAHTVGQLLRRLGQDRQVLCVTHLPQVAAQGSWHLSVRKVADAQGRPSTSVRALASKERENEIARMLGAGADDAPALAHARGLLAQA
jgi:DNA repair protein RecN (Recombination protein N)